MQSNRTEYSPSGHMAKNCQEKRCRDLRCRQDGLLGSAG